MEQRARLTNAFQIGLTGTIGALAALLLGAAITQTATILTYVGLAVFIALGLDPLVRYLINRKVPRPLAVAIVVIFFLSSVLLLLWVVIPIVVEEAIYLYQTIPSLVTSLVSSDAISQLDAQVEGAITRATENLLGYISDSANWPTLLGGVLQAGMGVLGGIVGLIIVVILSIYFMASLESMKHYVALLVPASKREKFSRLTDQVTLSVGRWVIGQVAVAVLHAIALFGFLSVLGAPFAPLLAVVAFFVAVVPLIGSVSSGVLTSVIMLFASPELAIPVAIYYLVYLQLEAYLISPKVMKKAVSVPAALVVIAALMGGTLLGILGAIVAIPLAASVLLVVREVWMPRQQLR